MILLDPYAARSCPVKTFNAFDPTMPAPVMDESLHEAFQGGLDFRATILDRLAAVEGAIDLREAGGREATWSAVEARAPVIIRPSLPADEAGHRRGHCDALLLVDDGYLPLKTKPYRVTEKQLGNETLGWAPLTAPTASTTLVDRRYRSHREGALLELAHVWRILEACGWGSATAKVAVVGDEGDGSEPVVLWVDLTDKFIRTFSRTAGYKLRSPLERYEHEHRFRVHVAEVAAQRTGDGDPEPVVRPIRVKECESCAWWQSCRTKMDDDDLSLRIAKAPLDVRELQTLLGLGIHTVAQLAEADIEAILPSYLPLTQHRDRSEARLRQAHRRAQMLARGVALERVSVDPIAVPRAAVELDFDIETDAEGRVYLWGCLLALPGEEPEYVAFTRFEHLDAAGEGELAAEFATWLVELAERYPELLVYHYSDYEVVHLRRLASRTGHPALHAAVELTREHFCDLYRYVRDNFVGVEGLGLKVVATRGAGFAWRDEDPGGLQSQTWFAEAVDAEDPEVREQSRVRVLQYNEDDVRATHVLRTWLTGLDA